MKNKIYTIQDYEEIAKRANEQIAKDFEEVGLRYPPIVTRGIVRAVLDAAKQPKRKRKTQ